MIEKKVSLRDLRELLEKRPKPRIIGEHAVFDYSLAEEYQKWIKEFTETFNKFARELREILAQEYPTNWSVCAIAQTKLSKIAEILEVERK